MGKLDKVLLTLSAVAAAVSLTMCSVSRPEPVPFSHPSASPSCPSASIAPPAPSSEVRFSPKGGCLSAIEEFVGGSRKTVRVMAYGFTSKAVAGALVAMRKQGVDVQVVLDESNRTSKYSALPDLLAGGVPTFLDSSHAIMHDKVVIVDGEAVETGSYNFTVAAEDSNAENCLFLRDLVLARSYGEEWDKHKSHSAPAQ
ncbi:MAG: Phospholipase D precursor [Synergistetes bacterium ADurb.BinA166]|nr:MAG: Phospholipase D precursor [Synergistetes bacterium ADurb.BinA166]